MNGSHYTWQRIPGGPRLAVASIPGSECAALSVFLPAGSRDDPEGKAGLAHFVEHMVFKGTGRRSAKELSLEIESAGGQTNACTSEEHTVYEARGDASLLPLFADILSDMIWNSRYATEDIDTERDVIGEEITMYRESPSDHIGDLISAALWAPHPLGLPISGSHESISRIDQSSFLSFRDLHHRRDDLVIAVAGPIGFTEAYDIILPHLPAAFTPAIAPPPFPGRPGKPAHLVETRDTEQLQLALAFHGPSRTSPQRHALRLLSILLGESASSRLFLELRENRGLCYQISSDLTLLSDTGAFEIVAGLDPESREEALACIERELLDLTRNGPTSAELERAKRLAISQNKMAMESTASEVAWAGESLLEYGEILTPDEARQRLLAVTTADVHRAAEELFQEENRAIAEIRPA
jgi:predicted Zn-dependent peptidase